MIWGENEINNWLFKNGLEIYSKKFKKLKICGALLPILNNEKCFKFLKIHENHINSLIASLLNLNINYMSVDEIYNYFKNLNIFDNDGLKKFKKFSIHEAYLLICNENELINLFPNLKLNRLLKEKFLEELKFLKINLEKKGYKLTLPKSNNENSIVIENEKIEEFNKSLIMDKNDDDYEDINDEKLCKICYENEKNTLTMPCNHVAMCFECSNQIENCIICRKKIQNKIKIFSV
jgi:hypothetical protein